MSDIESNNDDDNHNNNNNNNDGDDDDDDDEVVDEFDVEENNDETRGNNNNNNTNNDRVKVTSIRDDISLVRFAYIILFGIVGVLIRYMANALFVRGFHKDSFWSTAVINIIGSAIIGFLHVVGVEKKAINVNLRYGLLVGLLGGFTTFSGYALDSVLLFEKKQTKYTIIGVFYYILSPVAGIAVTLISIHLTRRFFRPEQRQQPNHNNSNDNNNNNNNNNHNDIELQQR
ncbi:hypothetical protein PPL_05700 [Heterostelium album PN500]|uniref:Fluoride ion transporter CrcB n=1 Tax=Heterostelium pallidum (strain ATCC 26659 / Pp 5 / PN500) TaxID=670386 RepID=D3BAW9_HETP5|nr:hypothetical protein PPL_05700 [Heterostelium album PN500]EFA81706.1 hypothetical protein PPL_05700 [Heterostelium album PN500]|eukprot:XP_020433823.1 hypothetical protein PPL_05700 [Heterostelium album PN500]